MKAHHALRKAQQAAARSIGVFVQDLGRGLLEISHNTLALVGLAVVTALILTVGRADIRANLETTALDWLQTRHEERATLSGDMLVTVGDQAAVTRATAVDPKELTREQSSVAGWIARRYKVAPEPIARLVQEAWAIGHRAGLDPTLILAIMAVESSFNPFAQSSVGAQGLMQVMTRVHDDKYEAFGGIHAAFDPISNLRVGVQVLKDCITRAGNLNDGLRYYVGAALLDGDGGYVGRVLAEQVQLRSVANGRPLPAVARTPAAASPKTMLSPAPAATPEPLGSAEQVALLH